MSRLSVAGEIWIDQITSAPQKPIEWIWEGFIAPGNLTLLTSHWKAGKTTLVSILLGLRVAGGTLGGLAVRSGNTLVISEEATSYWGERARKYQLGANLCFIPQPFRTIPSQEQWLELIGRILAIRQHHGIDLFIIDPLAPFLRGENHARSMLEVLLPLGELTRAGMAGLLLHHPGRGERPLGQAARGSGALLGHVDVSIDMRHPGGNPLTRRRRLFAISRHEATTRELMLELDQDGTTYRLVDPESNEPTENHWEPLRLVLLDAPQKLTRRDIRMEWPTDFECPPEKTLCSLLAGAVEQGMVLCEGSGRRSDPFRYWIAEREAVWKQDPLWDMLEEQRQRLNLPFESLAQRKEKLRQAGEYGGGPAEDAE
jgi:hypothetical protein